MKPTHILITALILTALLCAAPVAADAVTHNGKTYMNYDQIYASTTLSSSEKLSLVQEMAGWTEELAAYMEWKNSGGLEAYQAAVSGGNSTNSTSSDYGWNEAPGDGLGDGGTNIEPEYSYQERQAYDAAYAAYQAEFAENYAATAAYTGSGSGTQADPYIITTQAELQSINDDLTAHYKLGNDIVLSSSFSTIGSASSRFSGVLDGDGFAIINLGTVLICVGEGSIIKNIDFQDVTSGVIDGSATPHSTYPIVESCIFSGTVMTTFLYHYFTVSDCIFSGNIVISGDVNSPLILYDGSVNNVLSTVSMGTGGRYTGGITSDAFGGAAVDQYQHSSISNSVYLGPGSPNSRISGKWPFSPNYAQVSNCYALSTLTGYSPIGPDTRNGADVTPSTAATQSFYEDTLGWDFVNTWYWDSETNTPQLQVFRPFVPPTISAISASPSIGGQQDTYTLSVSASTTAAGGIASYQWYGRIGSSGEWQAITDGTSATYQFVPGAYAIGDFYFKCIIIGADGGVIDSYDAGYTNIKVTVVLAPQITSPAATPASGPLTQTITLSADVTSTETATYQWQELVSGTWTNISGATAPTATVNIADSAATTHSYRLLATNVGGTTTSATVTYTSVAPPVISSVTANPTTGPLTQSVTLSAEVSGATSYQWQEQIGGNWQNIAGATSATHTANIADTAATTHSYRLLATNVGGTTTSATVAYTSVAPPVISSTTANPTTGPLTQSVTLSASVSGATSYQWQEQIGGNWQNIAGATSATHTANIADTAATTHSYRLQATNVGGTTTSATVAYTSVAAPTISSVTANPTTGPLTQSVTLSATVSGATSYQWQKLSGSTWQNIQGATSATYTANIADSAATTHSYRLQATNIGGTTTSAIVTYTSVLPPTINTVSATPASGPLTQTVTLTVSATGAAQYQWQQLTGTTWNNINGATASTHTVTISDNAPTLHSYRVVVSNVGGSITSDTVIYQSSTGPIINTISATPTSGPLTQTVTLTVSATSTNTISYQWEELIGSTWTAISGATTPTYSVSITDTNPTTHRYRVLATDIGGTTPSETITYTSIAPPNIQAVNINPAVGKYTETITLSAEVSGADTYQWQQLTGTTWNNISGATTVPWIGTLTVTGDTQYRLLATNAGGTTTSQTIQYTIAGPANIQSLTATPSVVAIPGSTTLQITGTNIVSVEWQKLSGSTWQTIGSGQALTTTITTLGETSFRAQVEGADGTTTTSNSIVVLSGYAPTVDIIEPANNDEFPSGATVQFQATITGTDVTYEWDFGVRGEGYTNINPTSATYSADGYKTVTLRAESIFGTATDSITFLVGKAPRPMQTETIDRLDETPMEQWMQTFTPNQNTQTPDLMGVFSNLLNPYTNQFGNWVFLLLFAVPYLIIWIRQKNILIPSILGVLFGSWILVQFPSSAVLPAIGILVLSISGGIYGIYVKYQR